jgi:prepilin-type N-terminal cleavage/methylation domain-containing protein
VSALRVRDRVRSGQERDGGFTLSELLVVIVIMGIIGGIVGTVVRIGLTHQSQMQVRNSSFADARKVIQRVDRDIRSAFLATGSNSTSIVLDEYVNGLNSAPTVVTYALSGSTLTYKSCATCTAKTLIRNLVQTSTNPVFTFGSTFSYSSSQPSSDVGVVNKTYCNYVANPSQIDPGCVGTISVHLMVQPATIKQPINIGDGGTELRNS